MYNYTGFIFVILLGTAVFLLSYGKGQAGYEDNKLEFVSPEELGGQMKPTPGEADHDHENDEHRPVPLKPPHADQPENSAVQEIIASEEDFKIASYKLGSGDKVKISVFGEQELSDTYLVNEEGFISLPLIGDIKVKGKTIQHVKKVIEAKLSEGYLVDPSIAMEVAEFRPIYVMGEVRTPGKYSFVTDMTVRNAVAIAGGFTYRANQDNVRILRELNKHSVYRIEGVDPDMKIEPGDTVLIKERFF